MRRCFVPALFGHAKGDGFILPHHSTQLHQRYSGDKNLVLFDGDHNTPRPGFFADSGMIFLCEAMQV